jgi:hypothetical protein
MKPVRLKQLKDLYFPKVSYSKALKGASYQLAAADVVSAYFHG